MLCIVQHDPINYWWRLLQFLASINKRQYRYIIKLLRLLIDTAALHLKIFDERISHPVKRKSAVLFNVKFGVILCAI